MKYLTVIFGVLIGAFIGALIEGIQGWCKMVVAGIFGGLAIFVLMLMGLIKLSEKIWPSRGDWYATSSYPYELPPNNPQRAIDRNRREHWRSSDPQEEGAWFEVDMGKPRTIANIKFFADDHNIEKPKKWRMFFYREDNNKLKHTLGHKDGEYDIIVTSRDIPNPIQWFRVVIQEVAEEMLANSNYAKRNLTTKVYWTISFIRLKEYKFNICRKRFWEHEL